MFFFFVLFNFTNSILKQCRRRRLRRHRNLLERLLKWQSNSLRNTYHIDSVVGVLRLLEPAHVLAGAVAPSATVSVACTTALSAWHICVSC
jgi:hypothetical protein